MGRTDFLGPVTPAFMITSRSGREQNCADGVVRPDGLVMGTYIHGIFDNDEYRRALVDRLRTRKGLAALNTVQDTLARKQESYNRLAEVVKSSLDMDLVYRIMGVETCIQDCRH